MVKNEKICYNDKIHHLFSTVITEDHTMNDIIVRPATPEDAAAVLNIYAYYVSNTAVSFEYVIPTPEEFRSRIANTLKKYPYFVALRGEKVVGYAYAGPLGVRSAYDWVAETTIYIAADERKHGLGRMLYETLENTLAQMGIVSLYACIAYPDPEDEYLTRNSAEFHAHYGFSKVGFFPRCGHKFGHWYNILWMEKNLAPRSPDQASVIPFPELFGAEPN